MKIIMVVVVILFAAGAGVAGYILGINAHTPPPLTTQVEQLKFGTDVEKILNRELDKLVDLGKDPVIIEGVKASNTDNKKLTAALINQLDQNWQKSGANSDTIKPYLTNAVALRLLKYQEENTRYSEIFVTDERGLNVGQTNKTSDYNQADEDWWVKSFDNGKGKAGHGEIEFDESSQTEAIALYVPVVDPTTGKAIGVVKVLLDINAVKLEI